MACISVTISLDAHGGLSLATITSEDWPGSVDHTERHDLHGAAGLKATRALLDALSTRVALARSEPPLLSLVTDPTPSG